MKKPSVMSVDQSMSHCALVIWRDGEPVDRLMIMTGSTQSKGKQKKDVIYFDHTVEQICHIVWTVCTLVRNENVEDYVMEALSFGSVGNATRDLAGLFYCIQMGLIEEGLSIDNIHSIAPTSVKSFARKFLPESERKITKEKVDKKTGKKVQSSAVNPMKKPAMVMACEHAAPGWLDGLTLAAGKADYADAYFIGKAFLEGLSAKGK